MSLAAVTVVAQCFNPLTRKRQKTGSVMHAFKQTAVDKKALEQCNILLTTVIFAVKFWFWWC